MKPWDNGFVCGLLSAFVGITVNYSWFLAAVFFVLAVAIGLLPKKADIE